jgi:uncharacterized lipoprotein YddW (UPF0748 family)
MFLLIFIINISQIKGIWIPRWSLVDGKGIFGIIDNRFNHIFLQIFGNGEAYYPSGFLPSRIKDDKWLNDFLKEAHQRGIRVSAWINTFYFWGYSPLSDDKRHPINFAPDWFVVDREQRSIINYSPEELKRLEIEGYYLSPANRSVRLYLLKVIEEIITKYDFDGIHLDYIRYPKEDFIYDIHLRTKFQRRYYYDPLKIGDDSLKIGYEGIDDLNRKWWNFVNDDLTEFVREVKIKVKSIKPECLISAAVKPDFVVARNEFYQDWLTWVNNDYIDFVCLMAYTNNIEGIINKTMHSVNNLKKVAIGVGIYNLSPETIRRQISLITQRPFLGFVYFSYNELKKNRIYLDLLPE